MPHNVVWVRDVRVRRVPVLAVPGEIPMRVDPRLRIGHPARRDEVHHPVRREGRGGGSIAPTCAVRAGRADGPLGVEVIR